MRLYTQNIDGLEEEVGLSVVPLGGQRGVWEPPKQTVVQLHGSFRTLRFRCTMCHRTQEMADHFENTLQKVLEAKDVPRCRECPARARNLPSRNATVGILRPDVVLYNEEHPHGWEIQQIMTADCDEPLDLLLVIGTRMNIPGIQGAIQAFSRSIHQGTVETGEGGREPLVLLVNRDTVPLPSWRGVIDVAMWIDCKTFGKSLEGETGSETESCAEAEGGASAPGGEGAGAIWPSSARSGQSEERHRGKDSGRVDPN